MNAKDGQIENGWRFISKTKWSEGNECKTHEPWAPRKKTNGRKKGMKDKDLTAVRLQQRTKYWLNLRMHYWVLGQYPHVILSPTSCATQTTFSSLSIHVHRDRVMSMGFLPEKHFSRFANHCTADRTNRIVWHTVASVEQKKSFVHFFHLTKTVVACLSKCFYTS